MKKETKKVTSKITNKTTKKETVEAPVEEVKSIEAPEIIERQKVREAKAEELRKLAE